MNRNSFIDVLKGICIIFIVITHFSWSDGERLTFLFPFWIDMAVPIFMIISGYVYSVSYTRKNITRFDEAYSAKNIISKIIRYTIPYIVIFAVEKIFYFVYTGERISPATLLSLLKNFLQGGDGSGGYYYPIMIQFIFLFPIIYYLVKKYKYKGVVICGVINGIYEILQWAYGVTEGNYRLLVFRYILLISIGCYLTCEEYKMNIIRMVVAFIIGLVFLFAVCYWNYNPVIISNWPKTSFMACLYIIPIAELLIEKCCKVGFKPLEFLGKASYNIFLTQMVWYAFGMEFVSKLVENRAVQFVINIAICLTVGLVFYMLENPITKKINSLVYRYVK